MGAFIFRAALLLLVCILLPSSSTLAANKGVPVFQIVTEDLPPYSYNENGKVVGLCAEIVREMLARLDHPDTIKIYSWSRAYNLTLNNSEYAIFSAIRLETREKLFKWVGPLVTDRSVFIMRKGGSISVKTYDDAKKVRAIGTYKDDFAEMHLKEKGFTNLESVVDDRLNLKKLIAGRIDLWFQSELASAHIARMEGMDHLVQIGPSLREDPMYLAFNKDTPDAEIERWQKALDSIKADGTHARMLKKYSLAEP